MIVTLHAPDGQPLNAKVEVEHGAIIIHSRGGAFGKPNLRNPDYRQALTFILQRLTTGELWPDDILLDSRPAQTWSRSERLVLSGDEYSQPVETLVTLIAQRSSALGRTDGSAGHGNSTRRLRIEVPGASVPSLMAALGSVASSDHNTIRLPAVIQRRVTPSMIDRAIDRLRAGEQHNFGTLTDYDVLVPGTGDRLPAKAVFGLALEEVIGRKATPTDFSAGWSQPSFQMIEDAGYPIIATREVTPADEMDDERTWAEGFPKRQSHLKRERRSGLAALKKRRFIAQHGYLFCERCNVIPSKDLGPNGDACIEVHHASIAISKMGDGARTRLSDLQCLCANCHRILHRQQLA